MQFDYDTYYRINFEIPVRSVIFSLIVIVSTVLIVVRNFRSNQYVDLKSFIFDNSKQLFVIAIALSIMLVHIPSLARGGIYLIQEKEEDAILISGKIEDFMEISLYRGGNKYYGKDNTFQGYGECIVIDGIKYYLMYGDLNEGDDVTIKVLPKSKLILEFTIND